MAISGFFCCSIKISSKACGVVGEKSTRSVRTRAGPKNSSTNPRALPDPRVLISGYRRADSSVVCFMAFNRMGFVSRPKVGADHPIKLPAGNKQ